MPTNFSTSIFGTQALVDDLFVNFDPFRKGNLWTWGNNSYGQIGNNTSGIDRRSPVTTFAGETNWKQVACAYQHNIAIKTDGTLWTWGRNNYGQLGNNTTVNRSTPVTTFAGGTNWKQVSGGYNFALAIKTDGTLWVWGGNDRGQLGDNTTTNRTTPVTTFAGGTNWKQVSGGSGITSAIKTDGTLWNWGRNDFGQLGDNTTTNRLTPVTTFAGGTNWKQVSAGGGRFHTAAIKTDGTLWGWGFNGSGQLGDNTTTHRSTPGTTFAGGTNWKQVSCGNDHTTAVKTNGTLWVWGSNWDGQLGNQFTSRNSSTPITTVSGGTTWKQVSGGSNFTQAIQTDGTLWGWGRNTNGQVGNNGFTHRYYPESAGFIRNLKEVSSGSSSASAITYIDDYQ